MEFDIIINDKPVKVRYGTIIKSVMPADGQILNKYGKPVPESLPLRGPATFNHRST